MQAPDDRDLASKNHTPSYNRHQQVPIPHLPLHEKGQEKKETQPFFKRSI
jgi:hypothetical protein